MLVQHLQKFFGHSSLRPLQERIIQSILDQKDVLAILPTGAGKSLCYQLPATIFPGVTLVISPLLALMRDQVDQLQARGIGAGRLDSTLTPKQEEQLLFDTQQGKIRLLYISPEKALSRTTLAFLQTIPISHICIDEAHCISQWGWDFRPEYRRLKELVELLSRDRPRPVVSALTATATPTMARDIARSLGLQNPELFILPFRRPNIGLRVQPVESENQKRQRLLQFLSTWKERLGGSALLYAATRSETEELAQWLRSNGFPKALSYHAGLKSAIRQKREREFQTKKNRLLVATSAFGMGIDIPDIRLVLHHTPPPALEAYIQEAGRAGRDGLPAWAVLLYRAKDLARNWHIHADGLPVNRRSALRHHLSRMKSYCESRHCLATLIEKSFAKPLNTPLRTDRCACSVCQPVWFRQKQAGPLSDAIASKFLQLKLQRKRIAQERNIPPYFLGTDTLLRKLAEAAPQTWQELKLISGVGHARLFYWGKTILQITQSKPALARATP